MSFLDLGLLGLVALGASTLTALVGFGGGTIVLPVLLLFMPPSAAIPFHGLLQSFSNFWRVYLFRRHMVWPLIWRYSLLLPPGVIVGLWFFQGLPGEAIEMLIGCLVLFTLFARRLQRFRDRELPPVALIPLGFVLGALNVIVGVIAPVLGVLMVRKGLSREALIATLALCSGLGHLLKVAAFGWVGFDFAAYALPLAVMVPAVMAGGYLGKALLGRVSEAAFLLLFRVLLGAMALKLILWNGLAALLG